MAVTLFDAEGNIIDLSRLKKRDAEPSLGTMRNPMQEHPSWGLTPEALGGLLRNSESIDPSRWFALAADIEEREWHYRGVLSTRKSAVAQLPVTVEAASDAKEHVAQADFMRSIIGAPTFQLSLMDVLDALGKGASFTEIVWDQSSGQWWPSSLKWVDQRWFRLDQNDLTTPKLFDDQGVAQPLAPYKWITHYPRLQSGLPLRGGLTRAAAWSYMFKNFDIKAWTIFLEVYGHPLRVGKYPAAATYEEKATLLNAVVSLGIDAAAIIPEGMGIEFVQAGGGGSGGGGLFKDMAEYLDQQMSKLVLGQTSTTDAIAGGHAVGKVQNHVREDIERYDCMALNATLNRDLTRPAIDLNFGPQKLYPSIRVGREETQNLELIFDNLGDMVDRGLRVETSQIYDLFGMEEPAADAELLKPIARPAATAGASLPPGARSRAAFEAGGSDEAIAAAAADVVAQPSDSIDQLAEEIGGDFTLIGDIRDQVAEAIEQSTSFDELKARIEKLAKGPASAKLIDKLALSMFNAKLAGALGAPIGQT